MNPAQNTNGPKVSAVVSAPSGKEQERIGVGSTEVISEIGREVELPQEVEKAGVEIVKETIELPPDVKKLGVTQTGPSVPAVQVAALPQVVLPISDPTVLAGLHMQILSSLRWLAVWCVRKLKRAHIALKNIHGKVVRVRN